ncbi:hypothetical protein DFH09DRAFT_1338167 [Mycena vulgaris]|nr:hypothetical protein DFH09DRAFT_1338167 [Mycena vulgaris]
MGLIHAAAYTLEHLFLALEEGHESCSLRPFSSLPCLQSLSIDICFFALTGSWLIEIVAGVLPSNSDTIKEVIIASSHGNPLDDLHIRVLNSLDHSIVSHSAAPRIRWQLAVSRIFKRRLRSDNTVHPTGHAVDDTSSPVFRRVRAAGCNAFPREVSGDPPCKRLAANQRAVPGDLRFHSAAPPFPRYIGADTPRQRLAADNNEVPRDLQVRRGGWKEGGVGRGGWVHFGISPPVIHVLHALHRHNPRRPTPPGDPRTRLPAEAFARHTHGNAHIVLVGRNRIQPPFLPRDLSLLRNVQHACASLLARFPRIHLLFLTAGAVSLKQVTVDRWATTGAARAAAVHTAGGGGPIDLADLGLKKALIDEYSAFRVLFKQMSVYQDPMVEVRLLPSALAHVLTHTHPGAVDTSLLRNSPSVLLRIISVLLRIIPRGGSGTKSIEVSGEEQLYALLPDSPSPAPSPWHVSSLPAFFDRPPFTPSSMLTFPSPLGASRTGAISKDVGLAGDAAPEQWEEARRVLWAHSAEVVGDAQLWTVGAMGRAGRCAGGAPFLLVNITMQIL